MADAHPGVSGAAANALGTMGNTEAVPYLLPLLQSGNVQVAVWAAFALTRLGDDRMSYLIDCLHNPVIDVRRSAILAVRQLKDVRAIPALLHLLNDEGQRFEDDNTVADAAHQALIHLGYTPPDPLV